MAMQETAEKLPGAQVGAKATQMKQTKEEEEEQHFADFGKFDEGQDEGESEETGKEKEEVNWGEWGGETVEPDDNVTWDSMDDEKKVEKEGEVEKKEAEKETVEKKEAVEKKETVEKKEKNVETKELTLAELEAQLDLGSPKTEDQTPAQPKSALNNTTEFDFDDLSSLSDLDDDELNLSDLEDEDFDLDALEVNMDNTKE
eukprot:TRINITY_DN7745_c0_g2_i1.p3 TRINITY_DN7745_c0_g2~~TRINITY_DN7745_c0_g2_i1.p3  ORF type:complete len:201 (-),score=103.22 TRINITY_DN7745_c0_g2_i1:264-866(-)